jgi:hypothetical protein
MRSLDEGCRRGARYGGAAFRSSNCENVTSFIDGRRDIHIKRRRRSCRIRTESAGCTGWKSTNREIHRRAEASGRRDRYRVSRYPASAVQADRGRADRE